MEKILSLYELNTLVREVIELSMDREYWVEAEISEMREVNGHCFLDLIQKDERSHTPVARAAARCWKNRWRLVKAHFARVTGQNLHAGMKALLLVTASFHESYGFAWVINDINPEYSLGDMARRRQEIIQKLKEEGVFDLQHELSLPLFCQHVAVISSESAAGYGDFQHQLSNNSAGFCFMTELFPAVMQGEAVEQSVIAALDRIIEREDDFDCVVIIRGGGATSDLSGFDTLALAENVANFPLPVIVGLGHQRDESVLDLIACVSVKTPTAAAALLIDRLAGIAERISQAQEALSRRVTEAMRYANMHLQQLQSRLPSVSSLAVARERTRLEAILPTLVDAMRRNQATRLSSLSLMMTRMQADASRRLMGERHRLELFSQRVSALDPRRVLALGYTITLHQGKVVRSLDGLSEGDELETRLTQGTLKSRITGIPAAEPSKGTSR